MEVKEQEKRVVPRNEEFSFLYKYLKVIPKFTISEMTLVPEFMDALRTYRGTITDEVVYNLFRDRYVRMVRNGDNSRTATNVMNKISKAVTGSVSTWREEI